MQFDYIAVFTVSEFNKNKEKKGFFPQDGTVINVFLSGASLMNSVAVGFKK